MAAGSRPVVSDERALASWLAERDDAELAATLQRRGISPSASWRDFFDAAAALLEPTAIDRVLTSLPRTTLAALASADATAPAVPSVLALTHDGAPYAAVTERVDAWRDERPDAFRAADAGDDAPTGGEPAAAERAFATCGALADLLLGCLQTPLARTGTGAVSAVDRKRLIEAGTVDSADELDDLIASAAAAGLLRSGSREWVVTPAGEDWLRAASADRWMRVVDGLRRALPAGLRDGERILPVATWAGAYPLDPEWPGRAAQLRRVFQRWGLVAGDGGEPRWGRALREGADPDPSELTAHLPPEIDKVYLQADLTAIAPGPLLPALDLRLRAIALRESRAQASTYRFTAASLTGGMTEGETAESIRTFLAALSLTGIPQPLEYLIDSTATRYGRVQIAADAVTAGTRIVAGDAALREAIAVDQALRPLGLTRAGDALVTRVARDAVYWALADARYPVVALGPDGSPEPLHRRAPAADPAAAQDATSRYADLIATLRRGHGADGEDAWLERELDQAVRSRSEISVVVRLPDGSERTLVMEATGLGGGRLRGRDRAADVERTLPVSSIVSVSPM